MLCLMSKMDLIRSQGGTGTGKGVQGRNAIGKEIGRYLDPDPLLLLEDINSETNPRFHALNQAIVDLVSGAIPSRVTLIKRLSLIPCLMFLADSRSQPRLLPPARCHQRRFSQRRPQSYGQRDAVRRG